MADNWTLKDIVDYPKQQALKDAMFKVVAQEGLPTPENIQIRNPPKGIRRTNGRCLRRRCRKTGGTVYRITVSTRKANFVNDENGKYIIRSSKQRVSLVGAVPMETEKVVRVAAHELAHLRYWDHSAEHTTYTEYLYKILLMELRIVDLEVVQNEN